MPNPFLAKARMLAVLTGLKRCHCPGTWAEHRDTSVIPSASTTCRRCNATITVTENITETDLNDLWPEHCKGDHVHIDTTPRVGNSAQKARRKHSRVRDAVQPRPPAHGGRNRRRST